MEEKIERRLACFPRTRFMGSKQKLLPFIYNNIKNVKSEKVLDAFSGSACVAYLFKAMDKEVHTNDFMKYCYTLAKTTIENNKIILNQNDIELLFQENDNPQTFISDNFNKLFFNKIDNLFLDRTYSNIQKIKNQYKRSLALSALARACIKKRPRGIFTYIGDRYNDGRRDLRISFKEQLLESIEVFNKSVFNNGKKNKSFNKDIFKFPYEDYDIVYIDPPYFTPLSDNDYSRRYHFVEGLMSYWTHVQINHSTKTKKFNKFFTPFDSRETVYDAFDQIFNKFQNSTYVVSYSSNSFPTLEEMISKIKKYKSKVKVAQLNHRYSFGTQRSNIKRNKVDEYLFIGFD